MITFVDIVLLALLLSSAIAMVRMRNLLAIIMLSGIFSLFSAAVFMTMDAVDVAFTEAAVGAGITTVLLLGTMSMIGPQEKVTVKSMVHPFWVVLITGLALVYATLDMPHFGDGAAPIHHHVAPRYLEESGGHHGEVGPINVVTSVLASYRGYDTMGETAVIFTAAVSVLLLLGGAWNGREDRRP